MTNHSDSHALAAQPKQPIGKFLTAYIIGVILSLLFTLLAYHLVVDHRMTQVELYVCVTVLLVLQVLVHVVCFLRLNARTADDRWTLVSFLFTLLIMAIIVTGSLWIMYNLNYNMSH